MKRILPAPAIVSPDPESFVPGALTVKVETDSDKMYRQLINTQRRNEQEQENLLLRKRELERQHKINQAMIEAYENETK
jgi:hypothetical protein